MSPLLAGRGRPRFGSHLGCSGDERDAKSPVVTSRCLPEEALLSLASLFERRQVATDNSHDRPSDRLMFRIDDLSSDRGGRLRRNLLQRI